MNDKIDYLTKVYEIVKVYGLENNIVMDLGLINHMGYYSGVIFQGYVESFGKPVLMGGRYDQLGLEFGATMPAIGFACEIESLVKASNVKVESSQNLIDIKILYDRNHLEQSIVIANELRERNYIVLSFPSYKEKVNGQKSNYTIRIENDQYTLLHKEMEKSIFKHGGIVEPTN